jgi:hypothetical protein
MCGPRRARHCRTLHHPPSREQVKKNQPKNEKQTRDRQGAVGGAHRSLTVAALSGRSFLTD